MWHEADRTDNHRFFVLRNEVPVDHDDDKGILKKKAEVVVGRREEGAL